MSKRRFKWSCSLAKIVKEETGLTNGYAKSNTNKTSGTMQYSEDK